MELLLFHKKPILAKLVKELGCVLNAKGRPRVKSSLLLVLVRLGNTFICVSGGRPTGRPGLAGGRYRQLVSQQAPCVVKLLAFTEDH